MKIKSLKIIALSPIVASLLIACGSAGVLSTPIENIDNTPIKFNDLTVAEEQSWSHLDLVKDTIPGMSINKAYDEIIKGKKGKTIIVAVIDSGVDIDHEDLDDIIWINKDEIPNNGKDDDNNGYIDDRHGWNFLGDTHNEQLEFVRLLVSGNSNDPMYAKAQQEYISKSQKYNGLKAHNEQLLNQIEASDKVVSEYLEKTEYTREAVYAIKTENQTLLQHISIIKQTYGFGLGSIKETKAALNKDLILFNDFVNYHLNKSFKGRKTGDNPDDFTQKKYGNSNVNPMNKDESHGTHVAGIIGAERNNGKGMDGVANNVKIMPIRTVPHGDEYDKDVALAIRYAVDNGAKVINMSFGKYYSPHSDWVKDAIIHASKNDVLIVAGAGNESLDLDKKMKFPNDHDENKKEFSNTFMSVGSTEPEYGSGLVSYYSNYGKTTVDVFAPGSKIYSTFPENAYESINGTSMSAPAVAGIAALIRSQYPKLSAAQVKQILMDSGLPVNPKVIVGGNPNNIKTFSELSKSAKLVNAYNALILAKTRSNL